MPPLGNRSRADLCRFMGLLRHSCCRFEASGRCRGPTDPAISSEAPSSLRYTTTALDCFVLKHSSPSDIAQVCKFLTLGPAPAPFRRAP
jgi:hypothetical protein